jgi:hypothetical protein
LQSLPSPPKAAVVTAPTPPPIHAIKAKAASSSKAGDVSNTAPVLGTSFLGGDPAAAPSALPALPAGLPQPAANAQASDGGSIKKLLNNGVTATATSVDAKAALAAAVAAPAEQMTLKVNATAEEIAKRQMILMQAPKYVNVILFSMRIRVLYNVNCVYN